MIIALGGRLVGKKSAGNGCLINTTSGSINMWKTGHRIEIPADRELEEEHVDSFLWVHDECVYNWIKLYNLFQKKAENTITSSSPLIGWLCGGWWDKSFIGRESSGVEHSQNNTVCQFLRWNQRFSEIFGRVVEIPLHNEWMSDICPSLLTSLQSAVGFWYYNQSGHQCHWLVNRTKERITLCIYETIFIRFQ